MSERLIKTPIRYYFDNIMEGVKKKRIMKTIDWEQHRYEIAKEVFPSLLRLRDFEYKICYGFVGKKDHRITKAMSLTKKK